MSIFKSTVQFGVQSKRPRVELFFCIYCFAQGLLYFVKGPIDRTWAQLNIQNEIGISVGTDALGQKIQHGLAEGQVRNIRYQLFQGLCCYVSYWAVPIGVSVVGARIEVKVVASLTMKRV